MKNIIKALIIGVFIISCNNDDIANNTELEQNNNKTSFNISFFDKISKNKSQFTYPLHIEFPNGSLTMICPPTMLDPAGAEACDDPSDGGGTGSGCGRGQVKLRGSSVLYPGQYHMTFNYSEDENGNTVVSGFESNLNGTTFNNDYSQNGEALITYLDDQTVQIDVQGTITHALSYNILNGAQTTSVNLSARYNLCTGGGTGTIHEILEIYDANRD